MNYFQAKTFFKPTKQNVDVNRIGGNKKYITNGFWLFKKSLCPNWMIKEFLFRKHKNNNNYSFLKDVGPKMESIIKKTIEDNGKVEMKWNGDIKIDTPPVAILKSDKHESKINIYYLALLENMTHSYVLWQSGPKSPILIDIGRSMDAKSIGVIMPTL